VITTKIARIFACLLAFLGLAGAAEAGFVNFESGEVRPLALAPDGSLLFAANTAAGLLSVFAVDAGGLTLLAEVPVGLEPVAVAARKGGSGHVEAWVVNHVSDSVSVVDVDPGDVAAARVVRTLWVGDEPRDIVFAGTTATRAFVTTARRGQNSVVPPLLTTPGVGRALVWAFDADGVRSGSALEPLSVTELFCDGARALAVSPDRSRVYAAAHLSGNGTTSIGVASVAAGGGLPPFPDGATPDAPATALIVKFDPATGLWLDELERDWSASVPFSLPDEDVFEIDADASPPAATGATVSGVGTVLFNMAVRPGSGNVYVSNLQLRNEVRFEPVLRDDFVRNQVTIVRAGSAQPVELNPHIDRSGAGTPEERDRSLALPLQMEFSPDGALLYVTAFGSGKVAALAADALDGGVVQEESIAVGGGPSGLAIDPARDRLYVLTRFDNRIAIVAGASTPQSWSILGSVAVGYDPTPSEIRAGRPFLYDATNSAHGDAACASCHIFADFDGLAWDLGNPFGAIRSDPNPFRFPDNFRGVGFHPLKGPLMTQTLRGLANAGPMHWRGDRTAAEDGGSAFDEAGAFAKFNPAFASLLGGTPLQAGDLQALTDFVLSISFPPSPVRALDDSFSAQQAEGHRFFELEISDAGPCTNCHRTAIGTDGRMSFDGAPQDFKIAHLRNMYDKVGMFDGGDQVRGFGFHHNGSTPTLDEFLSASGFMLADDTERHAVEAFVLAFDTGLKPAVGQQVTWSAGAPAVASARIALLQQRADLGDCDLIAKRTIDGTQRGWVYVGGGQFQSDRRMGMVGIDQLLADGTAAGAETTFTCVPPGSGVRFGVDRDGDGSLDFDERTASSDPSDPAAVAPLPPIISIAATRQVVVDGGTTRPSNFRFRSSVKAPAAANAILPPAPGSVGDPTLANGDGAILTVYDASGGHEEVRVPLPAAGWSRYRYGGNFGYRFKSKDPKAPIARVKLATNELAINSGPGWKFALGDRAPERMAVRLAIAPLDWCAEASNEARINGRFQSALGVATGRCASPPRGP
jgi:DNA-binding beta-propeller fold protein YncE